MTEETYLKIMALLDEIDANCKAIQEESQKMIDQALRWQAAKLAAETERFLSEQAD